MYRIIGIGLLLALSGAAMAQQPQQSTVQQVMMQDATIKALLSEQLDAAHKQIQSLTAERDGLKKQLDGLKEKPNDK